MLFFFNDPATTEIYTLSLHDALPICEGLVLADEVVARRVRALDRVLLDRVDDAERRDDLARGEDADLEFPARDRKSTRLNSSHMSISYAVFCLKKKKKKQNNIITKEC